MQTSREKWSHFFGAIHHHLQIGFFLLISIFFGGFCAYRPCFNHAIDNSISKKRHPKHMPYYSKHMLAECAIAIKFWVLQSERKNKLGAHHYRIISDLNNKLRRRYFAMLCFQCKMICRYTHSLMNAIIIIQLMLGNGVWNTRLLTTLPLVEFGCFFGVQRKMVAGCSTQSRCTCIHTSVSIN